MNRRYLKRTLFFLLPFLFSCNHFFYFPDRNLYFPYQKTGYPAEQIHFQSEDGTKLFGWFFPSQKKPVKGTVVQFHGNAENISSHYLSLVWLTREGYQLFTFDYRGYGRSDGEPTPQGIDLDGKAALKIARSFHSALPQAPKPLFIVYGQSLGGAIAMHSLSDSPVKEATDAIVLDSTFSSYASIARKKLAENWFTYLFSPLAWFFTSDTFATTEAIQRNQIPLLVIHDKEDPAVPFSCGEEIFSLATSPKEFWVLDEGKHIGVFSDNLENRRLFLEKITPLALQKNMMRRKTAVEEPFTN